MWVRAYQFIQVLPEVTFNCCNSSDPFIRDFAHRSCVGSTPPLLLNELTFPPRILFLSPVTFTDIERTTLNIICKIKTFFKNVKDMWPCLGVMQFTFHWNSVVSFYSQQQSLGGSKSILHSIDLNFQHAIYI